MEIEQIVTRQRAYFEKGKTRNVAWRIAALKTLKKAILRNQAEIEAALRADLNKSASETYMCETGMVLSELSHMIGHLRGYAKNRRVLTPFAQFHAKSFTSPEPYGVVLVMSPWNYPFMLALEPAIGALAAGNCVVIKPSAYSPATSDVIEKIIGECFAPHVVAVVKGGRAENTALLGQRGGREACHGKGVSQSDAGLPGAGRQEPMHRGQNREHQAGRAPHRLRQILERGTDLRGAGLSFRP